MAIPDNAWLTAGQVLSMAEVNRDIPSVIDSRPPRRDLPAQVATQTLLDAIAEDVPGFLAEMNAKPHNFSAAARFVAERPGLVFRIGQGPFGRQLLESFANSLTAQALIDESKLPYAFHAARLHEGAEALRLVAGRMADSASGSTQVLTPEVHQLANLIQAYASMRQGEWPEGKAFVGLDGEMTTGADKARKFIHTAIQTSPDVCAVLTLDPRTVAAIGNLIMSDGPYERGIGHILRQSREGTGLFVEGVSDFGASYVRELPGIILELETGERPQDGGRPGLVG